MAEHTPRGARAGPAVPVCGRWQGTPTCPTVPGGQCQSSGLPRADEDLSVLSDPLVGDHELRTLLEREQRAYQVCH